MALVVADHPLAGHLLHDLRNATTPPDTFRRVSRRLTALLVVEATRRLLTQPSEVVTPLAPCPTRRLAQPLAAVPILRAGLGMLEPVTELFPDVRVGYIGLERNEETAVAREYYENLPDLEGAYVLCLDPMLATGGSASRGITAIKARRPASVAMVCVVAAPEGVARLAAEHPDVDVYCAALDERLDERCYIVPGLGDYGDRLNATV